MEENKIASFEEMVKNKSKKDKHVFLFKVLIVFFVYSLIAVYFFTPISKVSIHHPENLSLKGTIYYQKEDILKIANLLEDKSFYDLELNEIKSSLESHPLFEKESIKIKVNPFKLKIEVKELALIGVYNNDYYFNNNSKVDNSLFSESNHEIGAFLSSQKENIPTLLTNPEEKDYSSKYYNLFFSSIFSLNEEIKSSLTYLAAVSKSVFNYYFKLNDSNDLLRIKIPITTSKDILLNNYLSKNCFDELVTFAKKAETNKYFIQGEEDYALLNDKKILPIVCGANHTGNDIIYSCGIENR